MTNGALVVIFVRRNINIKYFCYNSVLKGETGFLLYIVLTWLLQSRWKGKIHQLPDSKLDFWILCSQRKLFCSFILMNSLLAFKFKVTVSTLILTSKDTKYVPTATTTYISKYWGYQLILLYLNIRVTLSLNFILKSF